VCSFVPRPYWLMTSVSKVMLLLMRDVIKKSFVILVDDALKFKCT
jgi:hypothetical protein